MENVGTYTWSITVFGLLSLLGSVVGGIYYNLGATLIVTIIGVFGSWTALGITVARVLHLEKTSSRIESEIEFTKNQLIRQITAKEIAEAQEKVKQISDSINNGEYRLLEYKLRNFLHKITLIKESDIGGDILGEKEYKSLRTGVKEDLIALSNKRNQYDGFDFESLNEKLVEVSDFLAKLEGIARKQTPSKDGRKN